MRPIFLLCFFSFLVLSISAQDQFPQDWTGKWAGDLDIYNAKGKTMTVPMELHLLPTDSTHIYDWVLMYKVPDAEADIRKYKLIVTDSSYVTDEQNSILLDGYLLGNVYVERFSVMGTLLTVLLEKKEEELHYRIFSGKEEAVRESGGATIDEREIPMVKSFPLSSYQSAVLRLKEESAIKD